MYHLPDDLPTKNQPISRIAVIWRKLCAQKLGFGLFVFICADFDCITMRPADCQ